MATLDDIVAVGGKRNQHVEQIQQGYGQAKDQVKKMSVTGKTITTTVFDR